MGLSRRVMTSDSPTREANVILSGFGKRVLCRPATLATSASRFGLACLLATAWRVLCGTLAAGLVRQRMAKRVF